MHKRSTSHKRKSIEDGNIDFDQCKKVLKTTKAKGSKKQAFPEAGLVGRVFATVLTPSPMSHLSGHIQDLRGQFQINGRTICEIYKSDTTRYYALLVFFFAMVFDKGPNKKPRRKPQPRPTIGSSAPLLEDEFQVIESDADTVSETSESGEEDTPLSYQNGGLAEDCPEMLERVRQIEAIPITFSDYLSCLDYDMLKLFFQCMFGFFFCSLIISLVFLIFVYFCNEDLWFEYFPVSDDEEDYVSFGGKFEL
eukprot:maker-scaffold603_size126491-snap-gene-0.27 protein:Tk03889 transcript:maker-scaffold603_size126491-snap-gene-0.27-mRNA-1 annotation:"abc-2 type transporter"